MRKILRNFIILIICIFITNLVFYNFLSDLIYRFMDPSFELYLEMMIFTATILYILSISIINKKVSKIHINILAAEYFCITIALSFFKTAHNFTGININPFSIINDFRVYFHHTLLLVVSNALIYLPLGIFIRFKMKVKNSKLIIGFLLYILLVETTQYITRTGIFDINDIILNTLGFYLGTLCSNCIKRIPIFRQKLLRKK